MAFVRRHPRMSFLFTSVAGVLLVGWIALSWRAEAAVFPLAYSTLDEVSFAEIDALRSDLQFDDDALACMNLSANELDAVLAAIRTWYETNAGAWRAARSACADQRARIRQFESAIRRGTGDVEALNTARTALTTLEAAYETLIDDARQDALDECSEGQRATYAVARAQSSLPMPYRAVSLTAQEQQGLLAARSRYFQRLTIDLDADERFPIRQEFDQAVSSALGASNMTALATTQGVLGDASIRVVEAVQRVLPHDGEEES